MIIKVRGIVIREVNYQTSDKIISILTEDNSVLSFKAKGSKKLNASTAKNTIISSISDYELDSRLDNGKYDLIAAKEVFFPYNITKSIDALAANSFMVESLNYIHDVEDLYNVYTTLITYLEYGISPLLVATFYLSMMIKWEGISLELSKCVKCGSTKNIIDVSYLEGGFLCYKCSFNTKDKEYLQTLRKISLLDIVKLKEFNINDNILFSLLLDMWNYFLESGSYKLRSFSFLKQVLES